MHRDDPSLMQGSTNTEVLEESWPISDDVMRLRQWATERSKVLPASASGELVIGSSMLAWLQLDDPQGRVSRRHATLTRSGEKWVMRDAGSKNKFYVDGKRYIELELEPGLEILIGGVTLVAESTRLIALRVFLCRLLGWATERVQIVDQALRSIRNATRHRCALVLCAGDDSASIARTLDRRLFDGERPFVMCDPTRGRVDENVRAPQNYNVGMDALAAAKHGTLCIWNNKLPRDFAVMQAALQDLDARPLLIVCAHQPHEAAAFGAAPIAVPHLRERKAELPRIIDEYAIDANLELSLPKARIPNEDRAWVIEHAASSLSEIEKATLRLRAIRATDGNMTATAALLGMSRASLKRWVGRRQLPMRTNDDE
jgi:hypothetical protein